MSESILGLNSKKREQIRIMFFIVKILALFFSAIPILVHSYQQYNVFNNYSMYAFGITFISFIMIMLLLMMNFNKNKDHKAYKMIEIIIFFIVFIVSIYVDGANESRSKYIFLFIIISYTIEYGMKTGLGIAGVATGAIAAMDLLFGNNTVINIHLEKDMPLFAMFFIVAWTIGYYVNLEKSHIKYLINYANIDGLTGAFNHRHFYEAIEKLFDESKYNNTPLSLLMIDLDYFKKYNDNYGHSQGDKLLKEIARILRANLRGDDVLFRYGGDEFCAILQRTDEEKACLVADRLREAVCNCDYFKNQNLSDEKITVSIGVSTYNDKMENYKDLVESADKALYRAKYLRRNKVEVYSSILDQVREKNDSNTNLLEELKPLEALITVINSRDIYTYKHVERVFNYCSIMADYIEMPVEDKRTLLYAAYLHDLGKINVPKETLITNAKLTQEQWEELKKHPQDSADILGQIKGFESVVPVVLQHHEKYDGTGYPNGLKGEEINYLARILTVVDSFDAMTNKRPYKKTKTFEEAFKEIERCKGTHFDPIVAEQFIKAIKSI